MVDVRDQDIEVSHSLAWWVKIGLATAFLTVVGIGLLAFTVDTFFMPGGNEKFSDIDQQRHETDRIEEGGRGNNPPQNY